MGTTNRDNPEFDRSAKTEEIVNPELVDEIYRKLLPAFASQVLSEDIIVRYNQVLADLEKGDGSREEFMDIQNELETGINDAQEIIGMDTMRLKQKAANFAIIDDERRNQDIENYIENLNK